MLKLEDLDKEIESIEEQSLLHIANGSIEFYLESQKELINKNREWRKQVLVCSGREYIEGIVNKLLSDAANGM
tara:strand:+ start:651 stop:869 length:219 start_codon:yes stop_codon:yes gene_type:complete